MADMLWAAAPFGRPSPYGEVTAAETPGWERPAAPLSPACVAARGASVAWRLWLARPSVGMCTGWAVTLRGMIKACRLVGWGSPAGLLCRPGPSSVQSRWALKVTKGHRERERPFAGLRGGTAFHVCIKATVFEAARWVPADSGARMARAGARRLGCRATGETCEGLAVALCRVSSPFLLPWRCLEGDEKVSGTSERGRV